MKKIEVHYFKFQPPKWLLGRIMGEKDAVKGIFTDACAHFWNKQCEMTEEEMIKKLGAKRYKVLKDLKYIENTDGGIIIPFLDQQFEEVQETKIKQSKGGKAGREKQLAAKKDSQGEPGVSPGVPRENSGDGPGNNSYSNSTAKARVREETGSTRTTEPLIEIFFTDLPSSTYFEQACRDLSQTTGGDVEQTKAKLLPLITQFRGKCRTFYPKMSDFADHFKNWANKQLLLGPAGNATKATGYVRGQKPIGG